MQTVLEAILCYTVGVGADEGVVVAVAVDVSAPAPVSASVAVASIVAAAAGVALSVVTPPETAAAPDSAFCRAACVARCMPAAASTTFIATASPRTSSLLLGNWNAGVIQLPPVQQGGFTLAEHRHQHNGFGMCVQHVLQQ